MTDDEYAEWMAKQNAEAMPPAVDPRDLVKHAQMFYTETALQHWIKSQHIENPTIVRKDALVLRVHAWIDSIMERPIVLSLRDFNDHAHTDLNLYYNLDDLLEAFQEAVMARFPHQFESPRHIQVKEWRAFFDQFGGEGIVAGTIERPQPGERHTTERRTATYYFSEANEAMFARVTFV